MRMNAVVYLCEKKRMSKDCQISCNDCPLSSKNNGTSFTCDTLEKRDPVKAVDIVRSWSANHKRRTYLQDFKNKYQGAKMDEYGLPACMCVARLGLIEKCQGIPCTYCWNEIMED